MTDRRVLIVTGGGRGIGAEIVRRAAAKGYAVCFSYARNAETADRLRAEIEAMGHAVTAARSDVAEPDAALHIFDAAETAFGPVTDLVNNAGITGRIGAFGETEPGSMRRVIDVNLMGTMYCAREAVRRWRTRGTAGCMVNISSVAATLGAPNEYVPYAAAKAGVETMSVGLAKETAASGIRVNVVSPGTVYTDIHAAAGEPDRPTRVVARVPMGRIGEPHEIADAVLFLLSPEASFITGSILRVSGGV